MHGDYKGTLPGMTSTPLAYGQEPLAVSSADAVSSRPWDAEANFSAIAHCMGTSMTEAGLGLTGAWIPIQNPIGGDRGEYAVGGG